MCFEMVKLDYQLGMNYKISNINIMTFLAILWQVVESLFSLFVHGSRRLIGTGEGVTYY